MYGTSVLHNRRVVRCSFRLYSNSTKKLLEFLAEMPKSHNLRINETQRHRLNTSKKSNRYSPSNVYLQVLGSGARGAPNTLYLFTDHKRYLFNCGECTQRLAHEHKVKLSKLEHIFITGKSWKNIGGLPGLSLTLQDVGVPNITLHGPPGLDKLYEATKRFVIMKEMRVTMADSSPQEDFSDSAISVKYIVLQPQESLLKDKPPPKKPKLDDQDKEFEEFDHDNTDYYRCDLNRLQMATLHNKSKQDKLRKGPPSPEQKKKDLAYLHRKSKSVIAYVVTLKKRMGTLDLAKCVEFGVKPGPQLGQLKNGQDIILPNGALVLSADVKTPDDPGPVFIVMEVPDVGYLKGADFSAHFDNGKNKPENIPTLVVHMTPPHVFNDQVYQNFIANFGTHTRHMVLNSQNTCLGSEAVHRTQHKLHLLDADIFPMLKDASVPAVWNSHPMPSNDSAVSRGLEDLKNKIALAQFQNIINLEGSRGTADGNPSKEAENILDIIPGRTLTMFHLRPMKQLDRSAEPKLHIQNYIQETMDVDGFVASLEQFRHLINNVYKRDTHKEYPKVLFLGTGSCIPSKTRNTSGIALQISEKRSMILDCGEGTFGQIVRFFGTKKVDAFLRTIKAVYISHLHADHHIGLISLIQARREAFESIDQQPEPVLLLAPGQIYTWLHMYDQEFERIKGDFTLVPNQNLLLSVDNDNESNVGVQLGVQQIQTCEVSHCPNAFGVAIQVDKQYKITYSGDTIPCDALAVIGSDSTLLIHEATMEDELVKDARSKMHSTTSQAIEMGRLMNAQFTVLTHFSQRYARLPRLNAHILNDNKSVGIAFDNMLITMNDLKVLPHMYAPLQLMFAEHCVEMELKAAHRAQHQERAMRAAAASQPARGNSGSIRNRSPPVQPPTPLKYRESNASKLRCEKKAREMNKSPVSIARKPRSHSSSSKQRIAKPKPPCLHNSDHGVPHTRVPSERTIDLNSSSSKGSSSFKGDVLRNVKSRTVSGKPSSASTSHSNASSGSLCGSKASASSKNRELSHLLSGVTHSNVRGKAQVPPVKKMLKRNVSETICQNPPSIVCRAKYPVTSPIKFHKAEKPLSFPHAKSPWANFTKHLRKRPKTKVDVLNSALIHIVIWRVAYLVSRLCIEAWDMAVTFTCLAVLFWTATKEVPGNVLRGSSVSLTSRRDTKHETLPDTKNFIRPLTSTIYKPKRPTKELMEATPKEIQSSYVKDPINVIPATEAVPATFCVLDRTSPNARQMAQSTPGSPEVQESRGSSPTSSKPSKIPRREQSADKLKSFERLKSIATEKLKALAEPLPQRTSTEKTKLVAEPFVDKQKTSTEKTKLVAEPFVNKQKTSTEKSKLVAEPFVDKQKTSTEKLKQQFCRDTPMIYSNNGRMHCRKNISAKVYINDGSPEDTSLIKETNNYAGMKSFKPQLEDIKSSYLLLQNKKKLESLQTGLKSVENEKMQKPNLKTSVIDETQRKKLLQDTMKKFQSREFKSDSRYNKIEGLNWISWKNNV